MTRVGYLLRSIAYYRTSALLVAAGVATATAVLTGSLVIGDSVRDSIRDAALARLGRTGAALSTPYTFRAVLASDLVAQLPPGGPATPLAALLSLQGSSINAETDAAAPTTVIGIDNAADRLLGSGAAPAEGDVVVSAALAQDLGLKVGSAVLLHVPRQDQPALDSLFARKSPAASTVGLRATVTRILPRRSWGDFALDASTLPRRNAFVSLDWLGQVASAPGAANTLLAADEAAAPSLNDAIRMSAPLEDFGVTLTAGTARAWMVKSRRLALTDLEARMALDAAAECGITATQTSTNLVTSVRCLRTGRTNHYSVSAGTSSWQGYSWVSGKAPSDNQVALGAWTAAEIGAAPGDEIEYGWLVSNPDGSYRQEWARTTISGVVAQSGPGMDPSLAPSFPGLSDAERVSDWDPPFPVDMKRVTPRDEDYWRRYKAAPRIFMPLAVADRIWQGGHPTRQASTTGIRLLAPSPDSLDRFRHQLRQGLAQGGGALAFQPVRSRVLASAQGSTDFAGLFTALGFLLIASGIGLSVTLLRLMAERRSREIGLLQATGFTQSGASSSVLAEGAAMSLLGALLGAPLGIGYAAAILHLLATQWAGAVASAPVWLHMHMGSVLTGGALGAATSVVALWLGLRSIGKQPALALLRGINRLASIRGATPRVQGLVGLAARSARYKRRQSLLTLALPAAASFIIILSAANARNPGAEDVSRKESGSGGFSLVVRSSTPIAISMGSPEGRRRLGFQDSDEASFGSTTVVGLHSSGGEEASCLNLARPGAPRVLGVPGELVERGGFTVRSQGPNTGNPWRKLLQPGPDGAVPAFADADTAEWILHVPLGGLVDARDGAGRPIRLRLAGLLEKSIFAGDLLVAEEQFRRLYPGSVGPRLFLVSAPRANVDGIARAIRAALGDQGVEVAKTGEVLAAVGQVQNAYLSTFVALGGLGLVLGMLGLATTILRDAADRRREFALLLALGYPEVSLGRLSLVEHGSLMVAGLALGSLLALGLSASAMRSPAAMVNWTAVATVLVGMLLVGGGACILAVRAAARAGLLSALRSE